MSPKILFVLENFFPAHRAGTETYVLNLAKGLIEKGWQVSVAIASIGKDSEKYEYEGILVYALSVPAKIGPKEMNGLQPPSNANEFRETLKRVQPEIVHFHSFSRSFTHYHLKAANESDAKVVFTAHLGGIFCARGDMQKFGMNRCNGKISKLTCAACYASQKHGKIKSYMGALATFLPIKNKRPALNLIPNKIQSMQYLSKYANCSIAIAAWIADVYKQNGITNPILITQAINTQHFAPALRAKTKERIQLGFVGRMNPSKGFSILLEALERSKTSHAFDLHVVTIQDTTELEYYTGMKNKFKTLGYQLWLENIDSISLSKEMDTWDIFILPSKHEVAPLTILEAFAKGIPVVGSDYPAIAEMIDDGQTGLLFINGSVTDLQEKLIYISKNRDIIDLWAKNIKPVKDIVTLVNEHLRLYQNL